MSKRKLPLIAGVSLTLIYVLLCVIYFELDWAKLNKESVCYNEFGSIARISGSNSLLVAMMGTGAMCNMSIIPLLARCPVFISCDGEIIAQESYHLRFSDAIVDCSAPIRRQSINEDLYSSPFVGVFDRNSLFANYLMDERVKK